MKKQALTSMTIKYDERLERAMARVSELEEALAAANRTIDSLQKLIVEYETFGD